MGKNNNRDYDRYERQDFSSMLDNNKKKGGKKPFGQRPQQQKKEKPVPVVPGTAKYLCACYADQIADYVNFMNSGTDDLNLKKELEFNLFNAGGYSATVDLYDYDEGPDSDVKETVTVYTLDRSVRFDKETHLLKRASVVAVACNGEPVYYINGYLNSNLVGNIMVVPIGEKGPEFRNAARWSTNDMNAEVADPVQEETPVNDNAPSEEPVAETAEATDTAE